MNSRRSYLETMNAGRVRRPTTSLEQLNRTLDELEGRIQGAMPCAAPEEATDRAVGSLGDLARSLDHNRAREKGLDSARQIAAELEGLRREMRHQIGADLRDEFAALRTELFEALQSVQPTRQLSVLADEFERLSGMVHHLGEREGDTQIGLLREEIEQIKDALASLAREDTLRSVDQRWSEIAERVEQAPDDDGHGTGLAALAARLDDIAQAVADLPNSGAMRSLDGKLKVLASAIDQFAQQQSDTGQDAFAAIDERLNEISRAIAATGPSGDGEAFARIEARMGSLARQIEELVDATAPADIGRQIETLTQRIDVIAKTLDHKTENEQAEAGRIIDEMDGRFARIAEMLEQRHADAMAQGRTLFERLEDRIDDRAANGQTGIEAAGLHHIESRLEEISARLDQAGQRTGLIDGELIAGLESQIAALSAQLAQPGGGDAQIASIHPRLEDIEQAIARNREELLEATRQAVMDAGSRMAGEAGGDVDLSAFAQDLKSLEELARRSDERNGRTFEAIHDTLVKIVDRLGAMHAAQELPASGRLAAETTPPLDPDLGDGLTGDAPERNEPRSGGLVARTPAAAAQEAAAAATADDQDDAKTVPVKRSLLGRLTGAIGKQKDKPGETSAAQARQEPEDLPGGADESADPDLANQPLEPGSAAPDLNAIMRRVRDERKESGGSNDEIAKSDFIAAARRAAQAAAAEAEIAKKSPNSKDGEGKLAIARLFKQRKKTLTLGIALLAITAAGMSMAPRFLASDNDALATASIQPSPLGALDTPEARFAAAAITAAAKRTQMDAAAAEEDLAPPQPASAAQPAAKAPARTGAEWLTQEPAQDDPALLPQARSDSQATISLATVDGSDVLLPVALGGMGARHGDGEQATTDAGLPHAAPISVEVPAEIGPEALREAAGEGDPLALHEIGLIYQQGRGVEADQEQALVWFEQAAEAGFAPAQYQVANIYEKGIGVERDIASAMQWYERAGTQGNANAMHNLAVLHAMGAAGEADNRQAVRWFQQAAELGVTDSQFNLGILAARGVGMEQNLVEAYKWFDVVARSGDADAGEKRDEVAAVMEDADRKRAEQTATLWEAKTPVAEANAIDVPAEWRTDTMVTASVDVENTVRSVQTLLNGLGYDAGPEDGMFGARTTAAIAAFQEANELEATGEIDGDLVRALIAKQ